MNQWLIGLLVGLGLMLVGGSKAYDDIQGAIRHAKEYGEYKSSNMTPFWYLIWGFIVDRAINWNFSTITSILTFLIGIIVVAVSLFKLATSL